MSPRWLCVALPLLVFCTKSDTPGDVVPDTDDTVEDTIDTEVDTDDTVDTTDTVDTDPPIDTGWPDEAAGFGDIEGPCGVLSELVQQAGPQLGRNRIDFADEVFSASLLSPGGQTIEQTPNRGGNSVLSEAISFDVLHRCDGAELLQTEGEITYDPPGSSKTDIRVGLDNTPIGVSVTRAFTFPPGTPMTATAAESLLQDKLEGAVEADMNVTPELAWNRHILHVMAYDAQHADTIAAAWQGLSGSVGGDTIVWITVTEGNDGFVYNID